VNNDVVDVVDVVDGADSLEISRPLIPRLLTTRSPTFSHDLAVPIPSDSK
jgi:hypothetical protein